HADRDQRDLARIAGDVPRRIDPGQIRRHRRRIDLQLPLALELDSPLRDRAEMGMEPEQRDQSLALDLLHLAGDRVLNRYARDRPVAMHLAHLAGSEDLDAPLRLERTGFIDRRLERPELVPPMNEHDRRARGVLETEGPVER